jgi:hypothetical protein
MDRVHVSGENGHALYPLFESYKSVKRVRAKYSHHNQPDQPWYGADGLRPRRYAAALASTFLKEVIRPPAGAEWVGFKEVRYFDCDPAADFAHFLDFMASIFPGAKFILNRRTGHAIADSAWYARRDKATTLAKLRQNDELMNAYDAAHPERCLIMDYDVYTSDPTDFARLFAFLGRPYDAALVERTMAKRLTHAK